MRLAVRLPLALFATLALVDCSKVGFEKSPGSTTSSSVSDNGDGSVSGSIDGLGVNVTPPANSGGALPVANDPVSTDILVTAAALPKITFTSPACASNTWCVVTLTMNKAYPLPTDFNWATNDNLWQTPGTPPYGKPGVHYLSTMGHVTFNAGETIKTIQVRNINPYTFLIRIGVTLDVCKYGQQSISCRDLFPK